MDASTSATVFQDIDREFELPAGLDSDSSMGYQIALDREQLLNGPRWLNFLLGLQSQPNDRQEVKGKILLWIKQAAGELNKEAGFLFLTLIADERYFPWIEKDIRGKAKIARRELYERVTNPEQRLKSQQAEANRDEKIAAVEDARLKKIFENVLDERSYPSVTSTAVEGGLKNFRGCLIAEAVNEEGILLERTEDGVAFLASGNQTVGVRVWLERKEGSGHHVWEEVLVTDGVDAAGKPIRFELSADASYGDVRPASSGVMLKAGEERTGSVIFLHQGRQLPAGEHSFWVSCYQGYHFLQGLEIKVRVKSSSSS
jgi:hypothetical protein